MRNFTQITAKAGLAIGVLIVPMATPNVVLAQDTLEVVTNSELCSKAPTEVDIIGEYQFLVGPGRMMHGGFNGVIPEIVMMEATLFAIDGVLGLKSSDNHLNVTFEEDRFYIPEMTMLTSIPNGDSAYQNWTITELEEHMACGADEHLPALQGLAQGFVLSEEMQPINATLELAIYNMDENGVYALGVVQGVADGMVMQMRVELTPK